MSNAGLVMEVLPYRLALMTRKDGEMAILPLEPCIRHTSILAVYSVAGATVQQSAFSHDGISI